jgi:pimeloyl-ACP methyl ester carboxylesterase
MPSALEEWLRSGGWFQFKSHSFFYRVTHRPGKPTVLLIHGFPTSSYDFAFIWQQLAKHFSLVTADMLGFGFSAKPYPHHYSIIEQADLFEALLKKLKVKQYHVLAHDYGVSVAQELLARQVGKKRPVLSVCFLNGGLYPEHHKPLLVQKLMLSPLGPLLAKFFTKAKLRASFDAIFGERKAGEGELEAFWQLIEYNDGRRVIPKLLHYMKERRQYRERWVNAMEATTVPLSMINGPMDPISGRHLAHAFAQRNPKARVEILEGVGHYPQVEAPEKVAKLYLAILGKQTVPKMD